MTKQELIKAVQKRTGKNVDDIDIIISAMLEQVKETVSSGEVIEIRGFGSFFLKTRNEKKARNISTGEQIIVPKHKIPFFKAFTDFRKMVEYE